MSPSLPRVLHRHRLAVKAEWARRLRAQPPSSALAHPEILVHLMDETLDQLGTLLSSKSRRGWIARHPLRAGQFHAECPCGMNPLLAYFSTGSLALHDALAGPARLNHDEQETIRQAWQTLAQREIEPLCSSCQRVSAMEFVPLLLSSGPCMQALAPD